MVLDLQSDFWSPSSYCGSATNGVFSIPVSDSLCSWELGNRNSQEEESREFREGEIVEASGLWQGIPAHLAASREHHMAGLEGTSC